jgi:predicted dehydrogenase
LGQLSLVTGVCAQPWIQHQKGTWRADPVQSGGGNLYDSGAHMFNAMLYLTGQAVTEVQAFVNNKGEAVDVAGTVIMRFADGTLGSAAVSGDSTIFEQGTMEHWHNGKMVKYPNVPVTESLQANFRDCILGIAQTPSPALLGLRQARLMDAIYASAASGKPVAVVAD